jgi:hypothetical protein
MFCPKCGQNNNDGSKFCRGCGQPLPQGAPQAQPAPQYQQPQYQQPPQYAPQQPPQYAPQMPPPGPARKKKMPLLVKILLGIVIFIVLIVILALAMTSGLVKPVEQQLSLFKQGNIQGAYMLTSKEFQNTLTLQEFTNFVQQYPFLMRNKSYSFTEREFNNNIGKVKGKLIAEDGAVVPIVYHLVKEAGEWKIIGFEINPKDF